MTSDPVVWGWISVVVTITSGTVYLYSVFFGRTRPHVFTWVIWFILTAIAFAVQYSEGAGAGSWASGTSALFCALTAIACYWRGERHITRFDWIVFALSISTIPLWAVTKDPLMSIILVTAIDVAAYLPTIRKSWIKPHEEMIFGTYLSNVKHMASFMAMENWILTTWLYPVVLVVANTILIGTVHWRRYVLKGKK